MFCISPVRLLKDKSRTWRSLVDMSGRGPWKWLFDNIKDDKFGSLVVIFVGNSPLRRLSDISNIESFSWVKNGSWRGPVKKFLCKSNLIKSVLFSNNNDNTFERGPFEWVLEKSKTRNLCWELKKVGSTSRMQFVICVIYTSKWKWLCYLL